MAGTQIWHHFHHTFSYCVSFVSPSNLQSVSNSDLMGPNGPKYPRYPGSFSFWQPHKARKQLLIRLHLNMLADLFCVCYVCQSQRRAQLWPLTSDGPLAVDTRWWKAIGEAKKGEEGGGKTWHSPGFWPCLSRWYVDYNHLYDHRKTLLCDTVVLVPYIMYYTVVFLLGFQ